MKRFLFFNWLKNVPLTRKLYFVVGIMALLIAVELFTLSFMIHTLSSTRALVGAEGLWSKAEKDAVYNLTKYGYTHKDKDYGLYITHMKVPMGDHKARLELFKPNPDLSIVREGFTEGRINADDIDGAINLLTRFHSVSYINKAISIWTEGDKLIEQLEYLANRLHIQVTSGKVSQEKIGQTIDEIDLLNDQLTVLEDNFSYTLGEGSRWIEHLILKILFSIAITVEFTGLFLTISVSRAISKGINEIVGIADKVSNSDLSSRAKVFSKDEIGMLATAFNKMIDDLQKEINEEKNTEEALRSQKDLYETLLKTQSEMGEGVSITIGEKIVYVNEAVCNIYGYGKEEILGMKSFLEIVPEEEKVSLIEKLRQRVAGERDQSTGETKIMRKDGRIIDIEYTVRNLFVEGKMQMISIIRDVTEKKKAEAELREERARAESAEIAKKIGEQFLANMSHEIRTPMNAIIGFTDVILKTSLTKEQQQYLDAIKTSGENLLVIINDILDLSRLRSGKVPIEQREFNLSHIISLCTDMMLPKAIEKGVKIHSKIDERIPGKLVGDPTRLNQVLLNLTANSIKFTQHGEIAIEVNLISVNKDDVFLEFIVKDTGIGIPANKLSSIFDAFTQANNDTARKYGGTGLGLAIVKQLVELQGGTVSVSSTEGEGSCFSFCMSYRKSNDTNRKTELKAESVEGNLKNLNILLVEDNTMNQLLAKKVLGDWGWNVEVAENGKVAIEKMKEEDFDLVLMDIQLPEMDGYEATRQIRSKLSKPKCNTPIIAMTAHVMHSEEEKCYNVGMNGYISKPFNTNTLYSKIASVVSDA
jgi:PAS domain S-box-containing protein